MAKGIPVIDLTAAREGGAEGRRRVAELIDRTCREIGFFTITGHRVPLDALAALRPTAHEFFGLPLEEKQRAIPPVPKTPRGYIALGIEALSYGNDRKTPPDLKEYYHFGRETWPDASYFTSPEGQRYFIPNLWPERPAGFRDAA